MKFKEADPLESCFLCLYFRPLGHSYRATCPEETAVLFVFIGSYRFPDMQTISLCCRLITFRMHQQSEKARLGNGLVGTTD